MPNMSSSNCILWYAHGKTLGNWCHCITCIQKSLQPHMAQAISGSPCTWCSLGCEWLQIFSWALLFRSKVNLEWRSYICVHCDSWNNRLLYVMLAATCWKIAPLCYGEPLSLRRLRHGLMTVKYNNWESPSTTRPIWALCGNKTCRYHTDARYEHCLYTERHGSHASIAMQSFQSYLSSTSNKKARLCYVHACIHVHMITLHTLAPSCLPNAAQFHREHSSSVPVAQ
jgi:hypothetical protein